MIKLTKEKFFELLRKTDFSDCATYTSLNEVYQNVILKLGEIFDLFYPS